MRDVNDATCNVCGVCNLLNPTFHTPRKFVGVLFVSKRTNHNNDVPLDSIGSGDACHDSVHLEPPETVHDIQYLCVCKEFRKHNIASELLDCCKAELAAIEKLHAVSDEVGKAEAELLELQHKQGRLREARKHKGLPSYKDIVGSERAP